jgi:hypothetical protein
LETVFSAGRLLRGGVACSAYLSGFRWVTWH